MDTGDKNWATKYLLDPLNAPDPSQEDGPGNTFRPGATVAPVKPSPQSKQLVGRRLSRTNPYRKSSLSNTGTTEINRSASLNSNGYSPISSNKGPYPPQSYPSPPPSATSPTAANHCSLSPQSLRSPQTPRSPSHREEAFGGENHSSPNGGRRRRGSSLSERYPGDMSHRPLDTLAKEKAVADRSRHATRKHHIQPDIIDKLDLTGGGAYHHGGPYDATLFARNNSLNSPLAAVANSNAEALKATPREKIIDSVQGHRPLDGVAAYAPGNMDRNGNVYSYEEGDNMMIEGSPEGGAYKRWPGVQYHPGDVKGKGEPSYTLEKVLKDHKISGEEQKSNGNDGIEMKARNRSSSGPVAPTTARSGWEKGEGLGRSGSISKRLSGGLKKRFGSIKRSHRREE
ncbi:uncharacterized protein A1O5_02485 [Cladophialophora psammophila CBS 110553]|uniref:Pal1 cell morphology protein n=1 Tax=Cladophialophora psammophila CBS 110553 TaxID=1182543 RepID=W9XB90_9EURO|nr:uncharacterized protein A1O5_02485 [Cladophialophora psammophila CBS 110553]EXJ74191.1 hypothetical protein A1O5_02485 [Cladophialophora psammophila CBS 110553]